MNKRLLFLYIILFMIISGCKKTNTDKNFTIENNGGATMTMVIYPTENDYINNTNMILSATIDAGSSYNFPVSKLNAGNWYYVDAYSSDYSYTNWISGDNYVISNDSLTPRRFKYTGKNTSYYLIYGKTKTNARISLLNKDQSSTRWRAYDALDLSSQESIWFSLSEADRYAEVMIRKNNTGTFYTLYGLDTITTNFTFGNLVGYPVWDIIANESSLHDFFSGTTSFPSSTDEVPTIDTASGLIGSHFYLFKKE